MIYIQEINDLSHKRRTLIKRYRRNFAQYQFDGFYIMPQSTKNFHLMSLRVNFYKCSWQPATQVDFINDTFQCSYRHYKLFTYRIGGIFVFCHSCLEG